MRKYKITYREGADEMSTVLVGADERKAVQAFSVKFPEIPKEDILSIAPVEYKHGRTASRQKRPSGGLGYTSEYEVARKVSLFMSFLGWICFLVGAVAAIIGASDRAFNQSLLLAAAPGLFVAFCGILLVAAAQVTRAVVDNADHTREILNLITTKYDKGA